MRICRQIFEFRFGFQRSESELSKGGEFLLKWLYQNKKFARPFQLNDFLKKNSIKISVRKPFEIQTLQLERGLIRSMFCQRLFGAYVRTVQLFDHKTDGSASKAL